MPWEARSDGYDAISARDSVFLSWGEWRFGSPDRHRWFKILKGPFISAVEILNNRDRWSQKGSNRMTREFSRVVL